MEFSWSSYVKIVALSLLVASVACKSFGQVDAEDDTAVELRSKRNVPDSQTDALLTLISYLKQMSPEELEDILKRIHYANFRPDKRGRMDKISYFSGFGGFGKRSAPLQDAEREG